MYDVRQFTPALYLLVLLGISGFALASESLGLWVACVALIVLNRAWVAGGRYRPIPRFLANALVVLAAAYVAFRITGEGTPVLIIGQFLVALQIIKLYEQRANRDYGQLIVLSLLLMVAAAISTATLAFGLIFVVYLFLSLYCCLLFHLKVETDAAKRNMGLSDERPGDVRRLRQDQRRLGSSMRRLTALVSVVAVTCGVIVFLAFPRGTGANFVRGGGQPQFKSSEAVTGFSKQVSFQEIARITQNNTPVAYVQVLRNGQTVRGTESLYLRGNTLDVYVSDPEATNRWTWHKASQDFVLLGSEEEFGNAIKVGPPMGVPTQVIEQRFELEPVGLDVLPTLAGTFLVAPGRQSFRHHLADGTLSVPAAIRRPTSYTVWSTGSLADTLNTSENASRQAGPRTTGDLMQLKALHDRTELMRLASLGELPLGEQSPEQRAREQHQRFGLLVPKQNLLDRRLGPGEATDAQVERSLQTVPYAPAREIVDFAIDPQVSGIDAEGNGLARRRLLRSGTTELDEQIARSISRYLQTQYTYTLDITDARLSGDQDPLAWFVGEDGRRGHCEFFAGTAALACQALGIPARVVVGFKSDEFNASLEKYVVRQSHAHAWIEVLTQRGWNTLDPTSGNGDDLTRSTPNVLDRVQHWVEFLEYTWANNVVAFDNGARTSLMQNLETDVLARAQGTAGLWDRFTEWLERQNLYIYSAQLMAWLIVAMAAAAALIVLWFVLLRWRLRRRAQRIGLRNLPPEEAQRLARQLAFFDELMQMLERHGYRRHASQTPREFAQSLAFLPRQAFDAVVALTDVFYRIRYGRARLTPRRHKSLNRSLDQLATALRQG